MIINPTITCKFSAILTSRAYPVLLRILFSITLTATLDPLLAQALE